MQQIAMNQMYEYFNNTGNCFTLVKMLIPAFMAILFLQSGLDKLLNYKDNLVYFSDHFKSTPLSKTVKIMTPLLTFIEIIAGFLSTIGVFSMATGNSKWAFWGLIFSAIALLCLFLGQRVAKDYGGAVSLAAYFMLTILGLLILV